MNSATKRSVLILCTGNSCRSHMAEGILRQTAGDLFDVHSAGSNPAGYVHPLAIKALREIDIDISGHTSKHLKVFLDQPIDTIIAVCDNADKECPRFPGQKDHYCWRFDDPAKAAGSEARIWHEFVRVRDEIRMVFEAYAAGYRNARGENVAFDPGCCGGQC